MGVESFRNEAAAKRKGYEWKENGRRFSLVCKKNDVGCFILCSVIDADGKRHRLFFPEGKGLLNGWSLLAEVLQGLGVKVNMDEKRKPTETKPRRNEESPREGLSKVMSFVEINKIGVKFQDTAWLDIG